MWIWPLGTWFSGGFGSLELMVGFDDIKIFSQTNQFYDSMTRLQKLNLFITFSIMHSFFAFQKY